MKLPKLSIALVGVSLAVSLIGIELALRFIELSPEHNWNHPDPELGWVNSPGRWKSAEEGYASMTFLADGRRAIGVKPRKATRRRVMFVGGSFIQGYGVNDNETYGYLLARKYDDTVFDIHGVGGYGTIQSLILLKSLLRDSQQSVDLVIYGLTGPHFSRNHLLRFARAGETLIPPYAKIKNGKLQIVPNQVIPYQDNFFFPNSWGSFSLLAKRINKFRAQRSAPSPAIPETADPQLKLEIVRQLVVAMRNETARHKARFLVVFLDSAHPAMAAAFKESNVDFLNCAYPRYYATPALWNKTLKPFDQKGKMGHPKPIVHKHWAKCMSAWIDRMLPIKRATPLSDRQ